MSVLIQIPILATHYGVCNHINGKVLTRHGNLEYLTKAYSILLASHERVGACRVSKEA